MDVNKLVIVLIIAAFLGNYLNFQIGKYLGKRYFIDRQSPKLLLKWQLKKFVRVKYAQALLNNVA